MFPPSPTSYEVRVSFSSFNIANQAWQEAVITQQGGTTVLLSVVLYLVVELLPPPDTYFQQTLDSLRVCLGITGLVQN